MAATVAPIDPWPKQQDAPVVFVVDAANSVERELLEKWITSTRSDKGETGEYEKFIHPIIENRSSENLDEFVEMLRKPGNTLVTPVRLVWKNPDAGKLRKPRLRDLILGDPQRPGEIRARRNLRKRPERIEYIAAESATIDELRARFEGRRGIKPELSPRNFAAYVLRQAGLALDIEERRLQGSRYKVPKFVSDSLRNSARYNQAIRDLVPELGKTEAQLHEEANEYLKEMVATPRAFHIDTMGMFGRFLASLGYDPQIHYNYERLERVRKLSREYPTALLFTHKSHVDGFVVYTCCYENDFPPPHILGGINMAFAGLGYLGRRAGAIFIRRTFADNKLYKTVLMHYLGYLLEKRFPLSWSFEGTRSRIGKLMPPRYGILKYVVDAQRVTDTSNVHFIPIVINYDLITDVTDYAAEQAGKSKRPESLAWFLGYLSSLRKPMGKIYVDFGDPVVLEEAPPEDDALALSRIAFEVSVNANKVTPITLPSLVTMSLLGAAPQALTTKEVQADLRLYKEWAQARNIPMSDDVRDETFENLSELSTIMIDRGILTRYAEGPEVLYGIAPSQHLAASYYRNTVVHHFVNKSILELALLKASDVSPERALETFWTQVEYLRNLFKFEFFYAPTEAFREEIREEFARYTSRGEELLEQGPHAIHALLTGMQPLVANASLLHYVEAYSIVAGVLGRVEADQELEQKTCVTTALSYGRQAYLQHRITSEASIAKLLFENAYKLIEHQGLTKAGGPEQEKARVAFARDLQGLLRRFDRIRTLVSAMRDSDDD